MARTRSFAVTVTVPRTYLDEVLDEYATGIPGRMSFVLRGAGSARATTATLLADKARNEIRMLDITDLVHSKDYSPDRSHAVVAIAASGDSVEDMGTDIVTAAGLDPSMLVSPEEQFAGAVKRLDVPGRDVEAVALMSLAQWVSTSIRCPMVITHCSSEDEASPLFAKIQSAMPTFVRDYVPVLVLNNPLRSAANTLLGFDSALEFYSSISIAAHTTYVVTGTIVDDQPEPDIRVATRMNNTKFDGRKVASALSRVESVVPAFASALVTADWGDEEDAHQAAPEPSEQATQRIADLEAEVAAAREALERERRDRTALARDLRKAQHALQSKDAPDEASAPARVDEAVQSVPDGAVREDYALYAALVELEPPTSMRDLLPFARERLSRVVLPGSLDGDACALDVHKETPIWTKRTWKLLAAMESFALAHERNTGGASFRTYCAQMPVPPINPRHVSARESRTVENNRKMREERTFEVATEVESSGRAYMGSHARVTASGKPPSPRMYFLDDTRGRTGAMHVGYIGEHLTNLATANT